MNKFPLIIFLLIFSLISCSDSHQVNLKVGKIFPDLILYDLDAKKSVSINENLSNIRIIKIWATWCSTCRQSYLKLEQMLGMLENDLQIEVITISVDKNQFSPEEYWRDYNITGVSKLWDQDMQLTSSLLGVKVVPTVFFVDSAGVLLRIEVGEPDWLGDVEPWLRMQIKN